MQGYNYGPYGAPYWPLPMMMGASETAVVGGGYPGTTTEYIQPNPFGGVTEVIQQTGPFGIGQTTEVFQTDPMGGGVVMGGTMYGPGMMGGLMMGNPFHHYHHHHF